MQHIDFYRGRVAINILACDLENAREVYDAAEGHAVIGVLSSQFSDVAQGIREVARWTQVIPAISVGLGAGDPTQSCKAGLIAAATRSAHVNQTFTGAGFAAGALAQADCRHTYINALVSPSGQPGKVVVSTGERSCRQHQVLAECDSAVSMILDMGAQAVKFFPMAGEKSLAELAVLATSAVRQGMTMIEPTGGIDLENFSVILETCLRSGIPKVMPHIYSAIIDKETGRTRPEDVAELIRQVKARVA